MTAAIVVEVALTIPTRDAVTAMVAFLAANVVEHAVEICFLAIAGDAIVEVVIVGAAIVEAAIAVVVDNHLFVQ